MWKIINNVTGKRKNNNIHINNILDTDGLITKENVDIGNELNNFFANVGKNIEYDFDKNGFLKKPWSWLNNKCFIQDSIFLTPISQTEIVKYISLIKPKNTFFEYGLTNTILKNTINNIIGPIEYIFNQIISTGVYPTSFKKCIVIPLYKTNLVIVNIVGITGLFRYH